LSSRAHIATAQTGLKEEPSNGVSFPDLKKKQIDKKKKFVFLCKSKLSTL